MMGDGDEEQTSPRLFFVLRMPSELERSLSWLLAHARPIAVLWCRAFPSPRLAFRLIMA